MEADSESVEKSTDTILGDSQSKNKQTNKQTKTNKKTATEWSLFTRDGLLANQGLDGDEKTNRKKIMSLQSKSSKKRQRAEFDSDCESEPDNNDDEKGREW